MNLRSDNLNSGTVSLYSMVYKVGKTQPAFVAKMAQVINIYSCVLTALYTILYVDTHNVDAAHQTVSLFYYIFLKHAPPAFIHSCSLFLTLFVTCVSSYVYSVIF